jgi:hypothetical protein
LIVNAKTEANVIPTGSSTSNSIFPAKGQSLSAGIANLLEGKRLLFIAPIFLQMILTPLRAGKLQNTSRHLSIITTLFGLADTLFGE